MQVIFLMMIDDWVVISETVRASDMGKSTLEHQNIPGIFLLFGLSLSVLH